MSLVPFGLVHLPWWGYVLVTFLTIETMFLGVKRPGARESALGRPASAP
jgi:hypothetical protein